MKINRLILQRILAFVLFICALQVRAQEGTKQFMPNSSDRLWLEIYRDYNKYFATYSASDKERLYIYLNAGETMHFGMKMANYSSGYPSRTSLRIKDENGNVVFPERVFPQSGNGYISSYNAAVKGPNGVLLNNTPISGGYDALTYTATTSGNHYIEFETWRYDYGRNNNWRYTRRFGIEFFDVTVTDASNNVITNPGNPNVSAGRLWSKGWAFTTTSYYDYPVKTDFYVFTADEFVNKVQYEMKPYSFNFVANSYGVSLDVNDNVIEKAQSQDGDLTNTSNISEYKIFLNDPDRGVWQNTALPPPAVQVWFDDDLLYDYDYDREPQTLAIPSSTIILEKNNVSCPYKSVTMFKIVANIDGFATIMLDLDGGGYSTNGNDRVLELPIIAGENYVLWDFKDDNGNIVSDGSYTASGTFLGRGPAHFPLYDVESLSGISTYSVRPFNKLGPTLYWDDSQVQYWGDQGSGTMAETTQSQLVINNHVPRVWTYNNNAYNGDGTTLNSWFNAIDLGMSSINFDVITSETKCVNGEAPVIGDVHKVGDIDEVLSFSLDDFTEKYYDPNDLPLIKIQIVALPDQGELRLNGVLVSVNQEINASDINNMTYTPVAGFGGTVPCEYKASNQDNYSLQSNYVYLVSNTAPTITPISDQTICTNDGLIDYPVYVGDAETPADELTVIAYSHDPNFVENNKIEVTGSGSTRYVNVTPVDDESGFAIIYVLVDDGYTQTIEEFALHVGPSVVINGDMSVCVGGDLLLTAEEVGASYIWQKDGTTLSTTQQLSINSVNLSDAGLYSLTVAKGSCVTTKDFMVSIAPAVSFTGDVDLCVGETIKLSADETVATTYSWRRAGTEIGNQKVFTKDNLTLADAGNDYTLFVEKEGCANTSAPFSVSVIQMLDINVGVSTEDVISGSDANITIISAEQDVIYTVYDSDNNAVASGSNSTTGDNLILTIGSSDLVSGLNNFRIEGDNGNCTVELVNDANINVNQVPIVSSFSITTNEDTPYHGNVLDGATDDDGGVMAASLKTGGDPQYGVVTINSNGSFTYTPNENYNGTDSFTFEVCDNQSPNACVSADVTVNVTAQNDAPIISTDSKSLQEDNSFVFGLSDFTDLFTDVDGDVLSQIRIDAIPNASSGELQLGGVAISAGQVIPSGSIGSVTFVPSTNWNGVTSFSWSASDGALWSSSSQMSLTVSAVDDSPSISDATVSVSEDAINGSSIINLNDKLTGSDVDVDGEAISYSIFSGNTGAVFTINTTTGLLTVNNASSIDYETTQQYTLVVRATDINGSFTDVVITINVSNSDSDVVLTISNQSITEGDAGTSNMIFTISSSEIVASDLSVSFSVSDISATYPLDYTVNTGSATINSGEKSTTISIPVVGDNIVEGTETFRVDLSSPSSGSVSGFGIGSINDNDNATLSIENAVANENDGNIDFEITLVGTVASSFDVSYSLSNGTAIGGADFNTSTGTITFSGVNGQKQIIGVPITDDAIVENSENFNIQLSTVNTSIDASDEATGTIIDNDGTATLSIANVSFGENESGTFRVTVDKAVQDGFSVNYSFVNGSAVAGTDFSNASSLLSFSGFAGEYKEFTVAGIDDAIVEGTEQFTIKLNTSHSLVDASATALASIIDDDAVNVTIDDVVATEGDNAEFVLKLNNAVVGGTTITYSFNDITAVGGLDYHNVGGSVVFSGTAGEIQTFSVALNDDNIVELDESFEVSLASSNPLVGADDKATVTITDNDGTAKVTVTNINIDENQNASFNLTLDKNVQDGFSIDYATENGSANAGTDYVSASSNVVFSGTQGESHTITIVVNDDNLVEATEDLLVNFSSSNTLVNTVAQAKATITDNDGVAVLTIGNIEFDENGSGSFNVNVDKAVQGGFDVDYSFTDITATGSIDFQETTSTLNFDGTANQTISFSVAAIDDNLVESSESFGVSLSTTSDLVDASATATGTINDNDAASISVSDVTIIEGSNAEFNLNLSAAVQGGVVVNYTLEPISATAVNDYNNLSGQINFVGTANEVGTIIIPIVDDVIVEANESFRLVLTTTNSLVTLDNEAIATITDNDGRALVSADDIVINENQDASITLTLDKSVQGGVIVNYSTGAGSAIVPSDFATSTGNVVFLGNAGETQVVTITINDDMVVESDENFSVHLSTAHNLVDTDPSAKVTIKDNDGVAKLSIENISFNEDGVGTYTVSTDKAVQGGFIVNYSFTNGTAIESVDYNGVGTSVSFDGTAGQTKTFNINAVDDNIVEGDESFTVVLSSASTLVDASVTATGTILDNDKASVSVSDVTVDEGENIVFTLQLDKEIVGGCEITYSLNGLTATENEDYSNNSGTVVFSGIEGEQQLIAVQTVDDNIVEVSEKLRINLTSSHSLVNAQNSALATITDNDGTANVSISNISITEGEDALLTLTLDKPVQGGCNITYSTINGTAKSGTDYNSNINTVSFVGNSGESHVVTVITTDDSVVEETETFNVLISSSNALITTSGTGQVTMLDNDGQATLIVENITVNEGGSSNLSIHLDKEVQGDVDVTYNMNDVSATGGDDYDAAGGVVTLSGTNSQTIVIDAYNDSMVEGSEVFSVSYSTSSSLVDASAESTITIIDDDTANLLVADATANEGEEVTFTVTLTQDVAGGVDVSYSLISIGALSTLDYSDLSGGVLNFVGTAGEMQTFKVSLLSDELVEGNETFRVELSSSKPSVGDDDTAIGTILDSNGRATVSVTDISVNEEENAVFELIIDKAVEGGAEINFNTSDLSANAGSDYISQIGVINFNALLAGEKQTITIDINNDEVVEAEEAFNINLSSAHSLVDVDTKAQANITDNDGIVSISVDDVSLQEDGITTVTVISDKAIQGGFDINYLFEDGTALTGVDFEDTPGVLNFSGLPAEEKTFTIRGIDDTILEGDETFQIKYSSTNSLVDASKVSLVTIEDDDITAVTVDEVLVNEENNAVFTLTLSDEVVGGCDINYSLLAGTAISDQDYVNQLGTVHFEGDALEQQTIEITVLDDEIVESNEMFSLILSSDNNAIIPVEETQATIVDNDGLATVSISNISVIEGDIAELTLISDKAVQGGFNVNIHTSDISANAGTDYIPIVETINFVGEANESHTVLITTYDDSVVEQQESLTVEVTTNNTLVETVTPSVVNINDNDGVATLIVEDATLTEGESTDIAIKLDKEVQGGVTINYVSVVGTADETDFNVINESIILTGLESHSITIQANTDDLVEGAESFTVEYSSNSTQLVTDGVSTVNITDEDSSNLLISDVSVTEGASATFTVTLSREVVGGFTVDYSLLSIDATPGVDYTDKTGTLTFNGTAGESYSLTVETLDDSRVEETETLQINLVASNNAVDASAKATLSINDNDVAGWLLTESDQSTLTSENGSVDSFTLVLEAQPSSNVIVDITGLDNTEGSLSTSHLIFTPDNWNEAQTVSVTGIDDDELDGIISYTLTLTVNSELSDPDFKGLNAVVIVNNEDNDVFNPVPVLSDDQVSLLEDEAIEIDVLANDTGLDDTPLTLTIVAQPDYADVTVNSNNTLSFVPQANYYGEVLFDYQVCDSGNDCTTASVKVTITPVNDAPEVNGVFSLDVKQGSTASGVNLLSTASDVDGDELTLSTQPSIEPSHGSLIINSDGSWSFTADEDYAGTDYFEFTICDNGTPQACVNKGVNINITAKETIPNNAPVAVDDEYIVGRNEVLTDLNVLENDSDDDGDNLIIAIQPIINVINGQLQINTDGTFNYTPDVDFTGEDTFSYQVCDDAEDSKCAFATVTITVIVKDTDADTIADDIEGTDDVDGDGQPNYLDLDSDDDGKTDKEEGLGDCDEDGIYDFLDADQCYDELLLSKGFSPNEDGINDTYVIPWLNQYDEVSLLIFNRWGNEVYSNDIYDNSWGGKANVGMTIGDDLPVGTYYYIITIKETGKKLTGYIYLNR
nr:Calx-beta domain-containing protein [uncultured Carboxylicivirga sp.]